MKKKYILAIYILVETVYFFAYKMSYTTSAEAAFNNMLPIYIIFILINSYLLYSALPHFKINMKAKSSSAKTVIVIVILLVAALMTNGPVELLIES